MGPWSAPSQIMVGTSLESAMWGSLNDQYEKPNKHGQLRYGVKRGQLRPHDPPPRNWGPTLDNQISLDVFLYCKGLKPNGFIKTLYLFACYL